VFNPFKSVLIILLADYFRPKPTISPIFVIIIKSARILKHPQTNRRTTMATMKELLELSVELRASDLHIIPGLRPQMRIDGLLGPVKNMDVLTPETTADLIYSILSEEQKRLFESKLVVELALNVPGVGNFRVSALHQLHGFGAVFRVLPVKVPSIAELGLPRILQSLLLLSHGLILVTGPTGSGKSTTLAAMIEYINNNRSTNIITIEDPIEYVYESKKSIFSQMEIGRDTTNFASALRASLRQDPNVIMLGELRDLETMRLALTAAETGHLVLATLHASSTSLAISRFTEVFPNEERNMVRNLLSETLQAVICQTLVKKITGGRVAAFEIMIATVPIRHFIRQDMIGHMQSAIQTNPDRGMVTMENYLQDLVKKQIVTSTAAQAIIANRGDLSELNAKENKK
jgi:twitching motility protein PilT